MPHHKDWDNAFLADDPKGNVEHSPSFGGALSFLRRKYSRDLKDIDVAVVGLPFDTATSNRPGARFGPRGVRAASTVMSWARPWPWDIDPLEALAIVDYGDCQFDYGKPGEVPGVIEECISGIVQQGVSTLVLGGDHFATYPVLRAYAEKHGPLSLVHFDAHSDTWVDQGPRIDHGTMFWHAVREGVVDDARSVQIGLRTTNDDTLGFKILDARMVHEQGSAAIAQQVRDVVGNNKVYLTFDIDCLDPSVAPGTGTPVCGGLSSYQALEIIRGLSGINLIGMDLMEVAPAYDVGDITSLAGASVAFELLCLFAANPHRSK
ncbi:MAG TPA: agmatinase [Xanthomonadales bacterium]|nr:agmatinase [Xanthomonadales bacterium]